MAEYWAYMANVDWVAVGLVALNVVGGASILVAALQKTVDPLREWARSTKTEADDRIVAWFAGSVGALAVMLQFVKKLAAYLAARPADASPVRARGKGIQ